MSVSVTDRVDQIQVLSCKIKQQNPFKKIKWDFGPFQGLTAETFIF